ncbi:MAG: hypothetical protein R3Y10_13285 [Ferrimonas sp.]
MNKQQSNHTVVRTLRWLRPQQLPALVVILLGFLVMPFAIVPIVIWCLFNPASLNRRNWR